MTSWGWHGSWASPPVSGAGTGGVLGMAATTAPPATASPATAATARARAVRGNLTWVRRRIRRYPIATRNAASASSENSTNRASSTPDSALRTAATAIRAASSIGQPNAPVDTAGKRHGAGAEFTGDPQRGAVARGEQRRAVLIMGPHGADSMDDPPGRQLARGGRDRLADGQAVGVRAGPQFPARGQDRRAAAAVDRPVHAPAAEQRPVRRVDHRIDLLLGDVTADQRDPHPGHDATPASSGRTQWRRRWPNVTVRARRGQGMARPRPANERGARMIPAAGQDLTACKDIRLFWHNPRAEDGYLGNPVTARGGIRGLGGDTHPRRLDSTANFASASPGGAGVLRTDPAQILHDACSLRDALWSRTSLTAQWHKAAAH